MSAVDHQVQELVLEVRRLKAERAELHAQLEIQRKRQVLGVLSEKWDRDCHQLAECVKAYLLATDDGKWDELYEKMIEALQVVTGEKLDLRWRGVM